jgi:hypothetical protein
VKPDLRFRIGVVLQVYALMLPAADGSMRVHLFDDVLLRFCNERLVNGAASMRLVRVVLATRRDQPFAPGPTGWCLTACTLAHTGSGTEAVVVGKQYTSMWDEALPSLRAAGLDGTAGSARATLQRLVAQPLGGAKVLPNNCTRGRLNPH